jgi:methionyl-tRNA synthetase
VSAARACGRDVAAFVADNADRFAALRGALSLSFDDFIRTGSDRHVRGVDRLWRRNAANGDFYRRHYTGLYCPGCEQFTTPAELVDGRCREHGTAPQTLVEENWFFRLSRYAGVVDDAIRAGRVRVEPAARRNEVLAFLRGGRSGRRRRSPLAASTAVLTAALPGARIITMAGQGHVAMLTAPDLFVTEVLGFLRDGG